MNKHKALLMLIVFLAATALPGLLLAQTDDALALEDHMRQVRRKIDEKRNSAIGTILQMTDEQSKAFRPLQKAYGKEIKQIDKKGRDLLRDFSESYDKLNAQPTGACLAGGARQAGVPAQQHPGPLQPDARS